MTKYCKEIVDAICARIADGDSQSQIEKTGLEIAGEMVRISKDAICAWKRKYPEFRQAMAHAVACSADGLFNKIQDLNDIDITDMAVEVNSMDLPVQLKTTLLNQMCNQHKEKISNIWRRLKILDPDRFGDKITQNINWKDRVANLSNADVINELKKIGLKAIDEQKEMYSA